MSDFTYLAGKLLTAEAVPNNNNTNICYLAVAALPDGSFFTAYVHFATSSIRCQRLGADLSILGTTDIPYPSSGTSYYQGYLYAQATTANKVILWMQDFPDAYAAPPRTDTWLVDCSGNNPAVGPMIVNPDVNLQSPWVNARSAYLPTLDLVVFSASRAHTTSETWGDHADFLELVRASTGAFVGRVDVYTWGESTNYGSVGMAVNPADPSIVTLVDLDGVGWSVKIDAAAGTGVRVPSPAAVGGLSNAGGFTYFAGDPYLPGGVMISDRDASSWPHSDISSVAEKLSDGTIVSTLHTGNLVNSQGSAASTLLGSQLVGAFWMSDLNDFRDYAAAAIWFLGIDQASDTPTLVGFQLPWQYTFVHQPDWSGSNYAVAVEPSTGIIFVGALPTDGHLRADTNYYAPQVWTIQGTPTGPPKPNLSGKPAGAQLDFWGN